jgi:hypothetical protein
MKLVTNLIGQVNKGLPTSAQCHPYNFHGKMKILKEDSLYLELDIKKSGMTYPHRILKVLEDSLNEVYPGYPWTYLFEGYRNMEVHDFGNRIYKPKRGFGYGHGNEVYTLTLALIILYIGRKGLSFNDDIIIKLHTESFDKAEEEALECTSTFQNLGFVINLKKRVISLANRFCEIYNRTEKVSLYYDKSILTIIGIGEAILKGSAEESRRYYTSYLQNSARFELISPLLLYRSYIISFSGFVSKPEEYDIHVSMGGWHIVKHTNINDILVYTENSKETWHFLSYKSAEDIKKFISFVPKIGKKRKLTSLPKIFQGINYSFEMDKDNLLKDYTLKRYRENILDTFSIFGFHNMKPRIRQNYYKLLEKAHNKFYNVKRKRHDPINTLIEVYKDEKLLPSKRFLVFSKEKTAEKTARYSSLKDVIRDRSEPTENTLIRDLSAINKITEVKTSLPLKDVPKEKLRNMLIGSELLTALRPPYIWDVHGSVPEEKALIFNLWPDECLEATQSVYQKRVVDMVIPFKMYESRLYKVDKLLGREIVPGVSMSQSTRFERETLKSLSLKQWMIVTKLLTPTIKSVGRGSPFYSRLVNFIQRLKALEKGPKILPPVAEPLLKFDQKEELFEETDEHKLYMAELTAEFFMKEGPFLSFLKTYENIEVEEDSIFPVVDTIREAEVWTDDFDIGIEYDYSNIEELQIDEDSPKESIVDEDYDISDDIE